MTAATSPSRRNLDLRTYADVRAEIKRLNSEPYQPLGNWNLSQICDHCNHLMRGSLEGFNQRVPWLLRALIGPWLKRQWLVKRRMSVGGRTVPSFLPQAAPDDPAPIAAALTLLEQLESTEQPLHPSPLLSTLSPSEWETLHTVHFSHHLSFLLPIPG